MKREADKKGSPDPMPLLFTADYEPKPAFAAVLRALVAE
jgi:hypothetical protein